MRLISKFDPAKIKTDFSFTEITFPASVPVILNGNWNNRLGIVDIFPDKETKMLYLDFSLYNNRGVKSVTEFNIKPMFKTSYTHMGVLQVTAFSLFNKQQ